MGKGGDFDKVADELLTRVGRKAAVVSRNRRNKKKREEGEKKKRKKLLVDAIKCRRPSFPAMPPQETRRPARFTSKRRAPRCVRDSFPLIGNVCPNGR